MNAFKSTLYFTDNTSIIINNTQNDILTQHDILNTILSNEYLNTIKSITIGTNTKQLQEYLFTGCTELSSITIYNTDALTYIDPHAFDDLPPIGTYNFYSRKATDTPLTYFNSQSVQRLIQLLPNQWTTNLKYTICTDFSVLCNEITPINIINTIYYNLKPIDISYKDFHSLFFLKNKHFHLTPYSYAETLINENNLKQYITINEQQNDLYAFNNLQNLPTYVKFNLYTTIITQYHNCIPIKTWDVNSIIQLNKQIVNLLTIYDFNKNCNIETLDQTISCESRYNTRITLDEMFSIFENQGAVIAQTNSETTAIGLPTDAITNKYIAVLTLYLRSNNTNVQDISLRMPYRIDFSTLFPLTLCEKNNYRYNP